MYSVLPSGSRHCSKAVMILVNVCPSSLFVITIKNLSNDTVTLQCLPWGNKEGDICSSNDATSNGLADLGTEFHF